MKIREIVFQSRRDFRANYVCEHCGNVHENAYGYDDAHFHKNVIPTLECSECGKTSPDDYRPLTTKYSPDQIV